MSIKITKIEILHNPTLTKSWRGVISYKDQYSRWNSDEWMQHVEGESQEEVEKMAHQLADYIIRNQWTTVKTLDPNP